MAEDEPPIDKIGDDTQPHHNRPGESAPKVRDYFHRTVCKGHFRAPSGSSLSSQEEAASRAPQAASSASSNGIPLTAADLDRFKQEIMLEVQREITKAKTDII